MREGKKDPRPGFASGDDAEHDLEAALYSCAAAVLLCMDAREQPWEDSGVHGVGLMLGLGFQNLCLGSCKAQSKGLLVTSST